MREVAEKRLAQLLLARFLLLNLLVEEAKRLPGGLQEKEHRRLWVLLQAYPQIFGTTNIDIFTDLTRLLQGTSTTDLTRRIREKCVALSELGQEVPNPNPMPKSPLFSAYSTKCKSLSPNVWASLCRVTSQPSVRFCEKYGFVDHGTPSFTNAPCAFGNGHQGASPRRNVVVDCLQGVFVCYPERRWRLRGPWYSGRIHQTVCASALVRLMLEGVSCSGMGLATWKVAIQFFQTKFSRLIPLRSPDIAPLRVSSRSYSKLGTSVPTEPSTNMWKRLRTLCQPTEKTGPTLSLNFHLFHQVPRKQVELRENG